MINSVCHRLIELEMEGNWLIRKVSKIIIVVTCGNLREKKQRSKEITLTNRTLFNKLLLLHYCTHEKEDKEYPRRVLQKISMDYEKAVV